MRNRILDAKTLGEVVSHAPDLELVERELAQEVVRGMRALAESHEPEGGSQAYWECLVGEFATGMMGARLSANRLGELVRELGLSTRRTRDGVMFFWNEAQVDILTRALGVEHE